MGMLTDGVGKFTQTVLITWANGKTQFGTVKASTLNLTAKQCSGVSSTRVDLLHDLKNRIKFFLEIHEFYLLV